MPRPPYLQGIDRPVLLLDASRARRNIERMVARAKAGSVRLRPHFKTHQSATIASWLRDYGVRHATVSSLDMAEHFAGHGWEDITVAIPLNVLELNKLARLSRKVKLNVLIDSLAALTALERAVARPVDVWIEIDTGAHRTGLHWNASASIAALATAVVSCKQTTFAGILTHSGHTYDCRSAAEVRALHAENMRHISSLRQTLVEHGLDPCPISIGDTPTCTLAGNFDGIDEVRPGNFVFYDLMQVRIGSCSEDDIALAVVCPVIGMNAARRQVVLYGGAVHFSKDSVAADANAAAPRLHGLIATLGPQTWDGVLPGATLARLSQEHGIVQCDEAAFAAIARQTDDAGMVVVLPVHSCLTADLYPSYRALDGTVIARRRSNDPET